MGTLASGSIDLKGLKVAGEGANKYITEIDGDGIKVHAKNNPSTNYTKIDANGMEVYQNVSGIAKKVAGFGASGAVIGENSDGKSRSEINSNGMRVIRNDNGTDTLIAHLGYGKGNIESGAGTIDTPYYILGSPPNTSSVSDYNATKEYSQGSWVKYDGKLYVYINQTASTGIPPTNTNYWTYYIGNYSLEQGWHTTAAGFASVAEGSGNIACGSSAHAEGYACKAYGEHSHAEGYYARSIGKQSHAEGSFSRAYGYAAHAEGHNNNAIGDESHVTGEWNDAGYENQFVCGKYNKNNSDDLFEVGNGTGLNARSNALTVDWNGNVTAYDYYSKRTTLNLGTYATTGFLSSSCGAIGFSIPTGRVFPSGTTISKITFTVTARVSRGTAAANAGIYCITSSTDGSAGNINYDSTVSTKFYNASGVQKTLTPSITTITLCGGTNIYIYWNGDNYLFGANSLYINNKPVVLTLTGINVTFNIPTA